MEMSQVRYVLAATRLLNFTRAAAELNVSQPALTKAIKLLEDELGEEIFARGGKRIALTPFGERVIPHLRQILSGADSTRALASSYKLLRTEPLNLGVLSTIGPNRLAQFLSGFHAANPAIELAVVEASLAELKARLLDGSLDAAIMTDLADLGEAFAVQPLYAERYVVVFPPRHRFAGRDTIRLADLDGESYVDRLSCEFRDAVMSLCRSKGIELYARFRSEREDWVQAMVLAGIGFAFLPECSFTMAGLLQRPLVEPEVTRNVSLVTLKREGANDTADLVSALQSHDWLAR